MTEVGDGERPAPVRAAAGNAHTSGQAAVILASSTAIGLLDAALVVSGRGSFRGVFEYVPASIWMISPLVALTVAVVITALVAPVAKRRAGLTGAVLLGLGYLVARTAGFPAGVRIAIFTAACVASAVVWPRINRWTSKPRPRWTSGMAIVLALFAAGAVAAGMNTGGLPVTARSGNGPNVIVVFLDTVRHDAIFARDGKVHAALPALSRFAAGSVVFERAYAPTSWTLPSHMAAVTGLAIDDVGVDFDNQTYRHSAPTLAERFRRRGYRTAAVISNSFLHRASGFERGFDVYEHASNALTVCRTAPGVLADRYWPWFAASICNWNGREVTARASRHLDDRNGPFLLVLNYMDAHDPYYVPRRCGGKDGYADAVRCLDRDLEPVLRWKSTRRETIVALVGDHGEHFGEHGLKGHGNSLYVQALHVPLLVRHPQGGGLRVQDPVSIRKLPALLDRPRESEAGPVTAMLVPPRALGRKTHRAAIAGGWHLIDRGDARLELYHLPSDPGERRNLIHDKRYHPVVQTLEAAIAGLRVPGPDTREFRSLGYVQ